MSDKKRFNHKFKLCHGNEWFTGDEKIMLKEFIIVVDIYNNKQNLKQLNEIIDKYQYTIISNSELKKLEIKKNALLKEKLYLLDQRKYYDSLNDQNIFNESTSDNDNTLIDLTESIINIYKDNSEEKLNTEHVMEYSEKDIRFEEEKYYERLNAERNIDMIHELYLEKVNHEQKMKEKYYDKLNEELNTIHELYLDNHKQEDIIRLNDKNIRFEKSKKDCEQRMEKNYDKLNEELNTIHELYLDKQEDIIRLNIENDKSKQEVIDKNIRFEKDYEQKMKEYIIYGLNLLIVIGIVNIYM